MFCEFRFIFDELFISAKNFNFLEIFVHFSIDKNRNFFISHQEDCIFAKNAFEGKIENFSEYREIFE